jgi:hypothetical protein
MTQPLATHVSREEMAARLEARLVRSRGQERLEDELRRIATDVLGVSYRDVADPADAALVRRLVESAVTAPTEPLVARFSAELARVAAALPPELRGRLAAAQARRDFGWD